MGIRHVVVFTWNEGVGADAIAEIEQRLSTLPQAVGTIAAYSYGADLRLAEGNYDFAVVADFATEGDYVAYRDNPEHRAIITELIAPNVASRCAVQMSIAA